MLDRDPKRIERIAAGMVGAPYVAGGRDMKRGVDCWGVAIEFHRRAWGIELPDPVSVEAATCEAAPVATLFRRVRIEDALPGDIARFHVRDKATGHLGIVLRGGRVLHPVEHAGVVIWPTKGAVESCYRYAGEEGDE